MATQASKILKDLSQRAKANKIVAATLVFLIATSVFSGSRWYSNRQEVKRLENANNELSEKVKKADERYILALDSIDNIDNLESYYYELYEQEKWRRRDLERQISNIRNLVFDRNYLDSLAKFIEYR